MALGALTNSSSGTKTQVIGQATKTRFMVSRMMLLLISHVVEIAATHFESVTGIGQSVVHLMSTDNAVVWGQTEGIKTAMAGETLS